MFSTAAKTREVSHSVVKYVNYRNPMSPGDDDGTEERWQRIWSCDGWWMRQRIWTS